MQMNLIRKRWLFAFVLGAAIVAFGVDESPNASDQSIQSSEGSAVDEQPQPQQTSFRSGKSLRAGHVVA